MGHLFAPERHVAADFVLRSYDVGDGPLLSEATNESYEHLKPWISWAVPPSVSGGFREARPGGSAPTI